MQDIVVKSAAKLNLTFDITGRRADGFHDVETIFQSIDLEDTLKFQVEPASHTSVSILCENASVKKQLPATDDDNLIAKAARAFLYATTSGAFEITVELRKEIPIGAGLAGGSGNAAATLYALNSIFGKPLSEEKLAAVAIELGSDVPYCLLGGTKIGRGRGEILETVDSKCDITFCIVKPRKLSVSTPWAYKAYDIATEAASTGGNGKHGNDERTRSVRLLQGDLVRPALKQAVNGLESGDLELAMGGFANVFEPVVFAEYPELLSLKEWLLDMGAWHCQMTGSGPTLFAVVPGREMAHHLRRTLLNDDELGFFYGTDEAVSEGSPPLDIRIARTTNYGVRLYS